MASEVADPRDHISSPTSPLSKMGHYGSLAQRVRELEPDLGLKLLPPLAASNGLGGDRPLYEKD